MGNFVSHFNLHYDPFDERTEARDFYPGGGRQDLLSQLRQYSLYGVGIAVVTGPLGSGKSTLAREYADTLGENFDTVVIQATLFMDELQLLESVSDMLELEPESRFSAVDFSNAIVAYTKELAEESRTLQIVIDDGHELGATAIQSLMDLVQNRAEADVTGEGGVKLTLLGESQLLDRLEKITSITIADFDIEPLQTEDVSDYLLFKMNAAGLQGRLPVDPGVIQEIQQNAGGVPGTINALVRENLSRRDYGSQFRFFTVPSGLNIVTASAVFGVILLLAFVFIGNGGDEGTDTAVAPVVDSGQEASGQTTIPLEVATNREAEVESVQTDVAAGPGETTIAELPPEQDESAELVAENELESEPAVIAATVEEPESLTETPAPVVVASNPQTAAPVVSGSSSGSESTPELAGRDELSVTQAEPSMSVMERRLLGYPTSNYTVQLLGSHSENNVKSFIEANGDSNQYQYFESRFQDKPWFVVVYGNYPDRTTAVAAIEALPSSLKTLKPWARNLADVQQNIRDSLEMN